MNRKKLQTEVAARLELLRVACDLGSQATFADKVGAAPQRFNNWMKGVALLPIEFALKVKALTGAPLEYIYCGDVSVLPVRLSEAIRRASSSASV